MKVVIVTGGTGGHIYPALALADYLKEQRNADIVFVGNDDRMEANLIPKQGYAFRGLHASGFVGGFKGKVKAIYLMFKAYRKAKQILIEEQPDVVIGFGGYVSISLMKAAQSLKLKNIIHEQNSVVGKSNQILVKKSDAIVICYEKCFDELPKEKTFLYGNPRASIAANYPTDMTYFNSLGLGKKRPRCLVVMGSLGSTSINEKMKDVLQDMSDIEFLYVSGEASYEETRQELGHNHVHVVAYVDQLAIINEFDFLICRAGATTAAEICASGVCSILIPSPYVAHNHQFFNAKALVDKNAARMIEEKDLNETSLKAALEDFLQHPKEVEEIKKNAKQLGFPNACEDILNLIERL